MKPGIVFPLAVLCLLFALSFSSPWIAQAPDGASLASRFLPPSAAHLLGTDELGRDVLARLLQGGRVSLTVALAAALISAFIGTGVGLVAGWRGGLWDAGLMRFTDFLIALPGLPLLIVLSALDLKKLGLGTQDLGLYKIIFLISLFGWTTVARLVRARTLALRASDFVRAARALGVRAPRIALRHILPNLLDTVIVAAALSVGGFILTESSLSFLGLGVQPPAASWGNMLSGAQDNIWEHAGLTLYPGAMIFVTVLAFNFLGDGLKGNPRA
jgi:peptide/nickel transport system permease protein